MTSLILLAAVALSASAGRLSSEERALHTAAREGDLGRVRALLRSGMGLEARDSTGFTALMVAVANGRSEAAKVLLGAGAGANASTPRGWTALMQATSMGRPDLVEVLLDAGADPDARDREAGTALDIAQAANRAELARLLRSRGSRGSGKSVGDHVCVRRWSGSGFCGVVEAVEGSGFKVRITTLPGCGGGCDADADCSSSRPLGGRGPGHIQLSDSLWIRSWCLTDTGLERDVGAKP
jgi:Ankyrin repeats (3 copies)/Ankyrin repeats (many copies)